MGTPSKQEFGKQVEDRALAYLLKTNPQLSLLARNYRWKGGEIDLVLEERVGDGASELVFVEVRARTSGGWVDGVESVSFPKQLKFSRTILHFLARYEGRCETMRADLLAWDGRSWKHLRDLRMPERM